MAFTKERKISFLEQAKANLMAYYAPEKVIGDPIKRRENKNLLDAIGKGDEKARLTCEAKRIALNTFFKELLEIGTDINDLLEDKT